MKILYIASIRLPTEKAHGLQIMKTCEAFAEAGNELELVVPTRRNVLREDPFAYYRTRPIFRLTSLAVPDFVAFGKLGFLISLLMFSERARFLKSFWSADVIYSRDALVLLQYIFLGRRLVFEAHGKPSMSARFVARRVHRVVVISKALAVIYREAGVPQENIIVAPDAVDSHMFDGISAQAQARAALGFAPDTPVVVYTGHLYARKGVEVLAHATSLVPGALFVFVGGLEQDVKKFRARWAHHENISVVGHVAPSQVPQYLRAADVLVLPNSGKDQDSRDLTSPMKLFEYMAAGKPIVASDVPSIREILSESSALFVLPDDSAALAHGISAVLADPTRALSLGQAAEELAKRYTWDMRAQKILPDISLL